VKVLDEKFEVKSLLSNPHIQTTFNTLFRKNEHINFEKEKFMLQDGDFLEVYWLKNKKPKNNASIVVLFHGLAGSFESPYIQAVMLALSEAGFFPMLMHFRGTSGVDNLLPRSYHSGDTKDAKEFLSSINERFSPSHIFAVGYSLGANMLLKLLGETGESSLIEKAIAISPPMNLAACSNRMQKGFSQYYQYRLLKGLKLSLKKKYAYHDMEKLIGLKYKDVDKLKTFWEFDDAYTAPIHGFKSAQEYYSKSSSKQYLKSIQVPTLIIHSSDDPFMDKEVIPKQEELSKSIVLKLSKKGGHVGFITGTFLKPKFWLEEQIVAYLKNK